MASNAKHVEGQKWSQLQTAQVGESLAHPAITREEMSLTNTRKKWLARLVDAQGKVYRIIHVLWDTPPSKIPFFVEFEKGILQFPGDYVGNVQRRFDRKKIIRYDFRITIFEYREVQ